MNRPIKYRAWHRELKVLLNVYVIDQTTAGSTDEYYSRCWGYHPDDPAKQVAFRFNEVDWMQFTGLTDKNGKEIYEGDIIRRDEIVWTVYFGLNERQDGYGWCVRPLSGYMTGILDDSVLKGEVVGNIYEDPNLLSV